MRRAWSRPGSFPSGRPGRAPRVLTIDAEDWFHVCGDDYYSDPRRWNAFAPRIERTLSGAPRPARSRRPPGDGLLPGLDRRTLSGPRARGGPAGTRDRHSRGSPPARGRDDRFGASARTSSGAGDRVEKAAGVRATAHRAAEWSIRHPADPTLRELPPLGFRCDASMTAVPPLGRASNPPGPHRLEFGGGPSSRSLR